MTWSYQDIINEADERYPNALTTESKLKKVYLRERELFRTIYRKKTATVMDIVAGQALYPLDFHHSKIIRVVWDGESTDYEDINSDDAEPPFIYTYENSIGRYPTPDQDVTQGLFIFHYFEPTEPTTDTIGNAIAFDPDFPMILVYGLLIDLAEIDRRVDLINGFTAKYNGILEEFKKANPEPELPPMRVE